MDLTVCAVDRAGAKAVEAAVPEAVVVPALASGKVRCGRTTYSRTWICCCELGREESVMYTRRVCTWRAGVGVAGLPKTMLVGWCLSIRPSRQWICTYSHGVSKGTHGHKAGRCEL
jgi:hypothetical protein